MSAPRIGLLAAAWFLSTVPGHAQSAPAPDGSGALPPVGAPAPPAPAPPATAPAPAASAPPTAPAAPPVGAPMAPNPGQAPVAPLPTRGATTAFVEVGIKRPGAWLELRSALQGGPWILGCYAPCGQLLQVDGMEARIRAPGMTPSNTFRIDPGEGTARLKVASGDASWRRAGLWTFGIGLPTTLGFGGLFGYGTIKSKDALRTVGLVGMITGGVAILSSLPMLLAGSTAVRDGKGKTIAKAPSGALFTF